MGKIVGYQGVTCVEITSKQKKRCKNREEKIYYDKRHEILIFDESIYQPFFLLHDEKNVKSKGLNMLLPMKYGLGHIFKMEECDVQLLPRILCKELSKKYARLKEKREEKITENDEDSE